MIVYRLEHKDTKAGMWHNYDGTYKGIIKTLSEGKSKHTPMPRTIHQSKNGKKWFSSVSSLEQFLDWFSEKDIKELYDKGYRLYEFKCGEYNTVTENETLFTRESVESKTIILNKCSDFQTLLKQIESR